MTVLLGHAATGQADAPADRAATLRHGLNLTNWFRFPASADPGTLRAYLRDDTMVAFRRAGFTFVRIAVQPELIEHPDTALGAARLAVLRDAVARLQSHGLGVMIGPHPPNWHLETSEPDRQRLLLFWHDLAAGLAGLDARLTFPEVLNEPVFANDPAGWDALQRRVLATIRAGLPGATVVLTGANWGSVDGLLHAQPVADAHVVYSFHFYEPMVLTTLAAFEAGLDRAALARLPFPAAAPACAAATDQAGPGRTRAVMVYYCAQHWDAAALGARIAAAAAWGRSHDASVVMGEFGAAPALGHDTRLTWLRTARQQAEAAGMGWALWGYEDSMGFGADPHQAAHLDPEVLRALGLAP